MQFVNQEILKQAMDLNLHCCRYSIFRWTKCTVIQLGNGNALTVLANRAQIPYQERDHFRPTQYKSCDLN